MGIHNEPGTVRIKLESRTMLIERMVNMLIDTQNSDRAFLPFKNDGSDEVVLMVNNLGSISELELSAIVADSEPFFANTKKRGLWQPSRFSKRRKFPSPE